MDIDIVNAILRLCTEKQTCLFEVPFLCNYCLEQNLCTNPKYVLASIKNYMEIFKISRDKNRIEFIMPFEICRNKFIDGICQNNDILCTNLHLCYDYFYTNSCRYSINCLYPHILTEKYHKTILGSLINLDLDLLTKAFRVYCQSKKHLVYHNSSKVQQQQQPIIHSSLINNPTPSSSMTNNWRMIPNSQINGNSSWKTNNRLLITLRTLPKQQTISSIPEKGLQICWKPPKNIQTHFIEVIFSNQIKSDGGPIQTHKIYQHLGVAQVFYQNLDMAERVALHGSITFQSFSFTSRLLQRRVDKRHICFSNIPIETNHIISYIDTVSMPYMKNNIEYYQNDKQIIIVEYNEDIDFSKISLNVRNHPECNGLIINCIQLYYPETLLIEYDQEYSEDDIIKLFDKKKIFHIKIYSYCSFVHFYSHDDLAQSINRTFDNFIRVIPIYIDIYSEHHLNDYLQRRQMELQQKPAVTQTISPLNETMKNESVSPTKNINLSSIPQPSTPILPPPPINQQIEIPVELKSSIKEKICSSSSPPKQETILLNSQEQLIVEEKKNEQVVNSDEDETTGSEDDFHDLPSDFDNDDLFLDEAIDDQGDMEYLRSAAKNLMSSLTEMEEASANTETDDTPHSLLYGDDYIITIKSRRFALAFLDYTQFRVEKQRNPDKFRLLASLKKLSNNKKRSDHIQQQQHDQILSSTPTIEIKTNKKKRNKRNKKKKNTNNNDKGILSF
ncbi:unnamed protein product [Rotaria sordida]|uniref:C3H1-type domain-containing protein n=1 Tax=Rotaria sordida TaxID=392033 RepID=A0A818N443_9BILA|nr:unnamed protein product [Rotaria sordida]